MKNYKNFKLMIHPLYHDYACNLAEEYDNDFKLELSKLNIQAGYVVIIVVLSINYC